MKKTVLFSVLCASAVLADSTGLGPWGLSGWQGLPGADIIALGSLRAGVGIEYENTDNGSIITIPVKGCWGTSENTEVSAVIPLVPSDEVWNGSFTGDMTLAGGWLYETARGGSALKLTGRLTLPTGEKHRDRGTELAFGGVTSTTFLDFRLSVSGEYALNGGRNPFNEKIRDIFYFTGGGTSYITDDLLVSAALKGSTGGLFEAAAGVRFILDECFTVDCGITAGLNENTFGINTGLYWTGLQGHSE